MIVTPYWESLILLLLLFTIHLLGFRFPGSYPITSDKWLGARLSRRLKYFDFRLRVQLNENNTRSGLPAFPSILSPFAVDNSSTTVARIPTDYSFMDMMNETTDQNNAPLSRYDQAQNRYFKLVEDLAPHEILLRFSQTAPRNVQEAVKSTIVSILGTMPSYALEVAMVTTNSKLANLMFQMQITGYMFKNAEYRMSLTRSLKGLPKLPMPMIMEAGDAQSNSSIVFRPTDDDLTVTGTVNVTNCMGTTAEVDASALMMALTAEVSQLRNELMNMKNQREPELQANLLTYVQALPEREMGELTSSISPEVMEAINLLVASIMTRMGVPPPTGSQPEALIQQSISAVAQLCMWQLVIGYKLRELEVLEKGIDL